MDGPPSIPPGGGEAAATTRRLVLPLRGENVRRFSDKEGAMVVCYWQTDVSISLVFSLLKSPTRICDHGTIQLPTKPMRL